MESNFEMRLPKEWTEFRIADLFKFSSGKSRPANTAREKSESLPIPVYGGNGVLGYTDQVFLDKETLILGRVGEYCGCVHLTEPLSWVSDNALYVRDQSDIIDLHFARYALSFLDLNQYSNKMGQPLITQGVINEIKLKVPSKTEQKKIAHVLNTVQQAIDIENNLLKATTELKRALMQRLFTEGTKGEKQKQTEIGLVPESWEVEGAGKYLRQSQYGLSTKGADVGSVPILRMTNQKDGLVSPDKLQYVDLEKSAFDKFKLDLDDILFNRTNSIDLVGKTSIFKLQGDYVFASYLIRIKADKKVLSPDFLNHYLNFDETQLRLKNIATRGVSQSNISATRLATFPIPVPPLEEQNEIVKNLDVINQKINFHYKKKALFSDAFKTLLHELMTGERRLNEVNL